MIPLNYVALLPMSLFDDAPALLSYLDRLTAELPLLCGYPDALTCGRIEKRWSVAVGELGMEQSWRPGQPFPPDTQAVRLRLSAMAERPSGFGAP